MIDCWQYNLTDNVKSCFIENYWQTWEFWVGFVIAIIIILIVLSFWRGWD
jgi:hypothetical protein